MGRIEDHINRMGDALTILAQSQESIMEELRVSRTEIQTIDEKRTEYDRLTNDLSLLRAEKSALAGQLADLHQQYAALKARFA